MDSRLRQQLLELHYDLLPEAEAEELRARLKDDVELAAAMVEVQRDVSMLARAARLEAPPLTWKVDESQITKALPQASRRGGDAKPITRTGARNSYWSWGLGIAAAVMLVFSLGGYQVHRTQVARLDREYPRVVVAGPSELTPNVSNRFVVKASTVAGEPLALNLVSTLHDVERDTVVQLQRQETDRDGNLIVEFTPKENAANHYEFRLARVQGKLAVSAREAAVVGRRAGVSFEGNDRSPQLSTRRRGLLSLADVEPRQFEADRRSDRPLSRGGLGRKHRRQQ
jgi:hypothetical protein